MRGKHLEGLRSRMVQFPTAQKVRVQKQRKFSKKERYCFIIVVPASRRHRSSVFFPLLVPLFRSDLNPGGYIYPTHNHGSDACPLQSRNSHFIAGSDHG